MHEFPIAHIQLPVRTADRDFPIADGIGSSFGGLAVMEPSSDVETRHDPGFKAFVKIRQSNVQQPQSTPPGAQGVAPAESQTVVPEEAPKEARLPADSSTVTLEDRDSSDDSIEDELDLVGEDEEYLEPDTSEERAAEAGMSGGDFVMVPADDIAFEDDESGVAS